METQSWTGISIETGFFPLSFLLYLCTPTIVIDGVATQRPWGVHYFPTQPGMHTVTIFFGYLFMDQCGANTINMNVESGRVSRIKFEMPPWLFSKGSIRELPAYTPR